MNPSLIRIGSVAWTLLLTGYGASAAPATWPQFRGPQGSGIAHDQNPPVQFNATSNILWHVPVPSGASSPCIWGDRVFLTAFDAGQLETLCLRRSDGQLLWRKAAPSETIESFHPEEGSPAAATPVADVQPVY